MFGFVRKKHFREALTDTLLLMKQATKSVDEATEGNRQAVALVKQSDKQLDRLMASAATWQRLYEELSQEKAQQSAEPAWVEKYPVLNAWVN